MKPSIDRLRELLSLDSESGELRWKVKRNGYNGGVSPGDLAGSVTTFRKRGAKPKTYLVIGVDGRRYMAHQIVVALSTGAWPPVGMHVDHVDGNSLNNRPNNLRVVSAATNSQNRRLAHKGSKSGVLGVSPARGKWLAQIQVGKRGLFIGYFSTPEEASAAYQSAKAKLHPGFVVSTEALA